MNILVLGASGKVGKLVVPELVQRGHTVRAFVHSNRDGLDLPGVTVLQGDVHDANAIASAVIGTDAVISALGSWGTPTKDIVTSAVRNLIAPMKNSSISRIVTVTGEGALLDGEPVSLMNRSAHALGKLVAGEVLSDGEEHIRLLQRSELRWTALRSPVMIPGAFKTYQLVTSTVHPVAVVRRASVARCMADLVESDEYLQQAPIIRNS